MSRVRDIANILSGGSSAIATDAEIPSYIAGKNFVINGGFDVYQRASFSSSSSGYTLDRWQVINSGGSATVTQQSSGTPLGSSNHFRLTYTSTGIWNIWQFIESSNVKMLQDRTVTLTAKIRRNATFSSNYVMGIYKSTTANAGSSASWSQVGSTSAINANIPTGTTSSDWITLTTTLAIPSDGTAEGLAVVFFENAANLNGSYIEISQVQLEIGSVSTPFSRAGGTVAGELLICKRYYENSYPTGYAPGSDLSAVNDSHFNIFAVTANGAVNGSSRSRSVPTLFSSEKRVTPTMRLWDRVGNINKYSAGDANGGNLSNNNSLDLYGGIGAHSKLVTFQTTFASASHYYAFITWEASAEL